MSAQTQASEYYHVYNEGNNSKNIFNDVKDFETFLSFLADYLSPIESRDVAKKTFQVNGKTFQGVPHQPKNYFGKIELSGYALLSNHYHLIVKEIEKGSVENLMRSLSTRYVMYYNKKHQIKGSLFQGTYKSLKLKNQKELLHLTRYIHREAIESNNETGYSSYEDYLGTKKTNWIKPDYVLNTVSSLNNSPSYKQFMEDDSSEDEELVNSICFESENSTDEQKYTGQNIVNEEVDSETPTSQTHKQSFFGFAASTTLVFLLLFGIGVRNIKLASAINSPQQLVTNSISPTPQVAGVSSGDQENPKLQLINTVTLIPNIESVDVVNIYQEPSTASAILRKAKVGEVYKYIEHNKGWYQIEIRTGDKGYVLDEMVKEDY